MEKPKKETIDTTSKGIRNLFRLEKENEEIKGRIFEVLRNITNLFDHEEEENYYKPVKASFFWETIILSMKGKVIE